MSLKIFHIFFIALAILLSVMCAAWAFINHAGQMFGIGCCVAAVLLTVYGVWFVRKSRKIIT